MHKVIKDTHADLSACSHSSAHVVNPTPTLGQADLWHGAMHAAAAEEWILWHAHARLITGGNSAGAWWATGTGLVVVNSLIYDHFWPC